MRVALCCVLGLSLLGSVSSAKALDWDPRNWDWSLPRIEPPRPVELWKPQLLPTPKMPKLGFIQETVKGNDTGGIIPWTPENEPQAMAWATAFCGGYNKYPRITAIHRELGDFITFNCLWTPYTARYALPEVHPRGRAYVGKRDVSEE